MNTSENDLPFIVPDIPVKKIKKVYDEDSFLTIPRPNLYSFFDNLLKIKDKKFLLESENDIEVWENEVDEKIEKVINLLDNFLENILEYKEELGLELRKYLYKSKLEKISYFDVQAHMTSSVYDGISDGLDSIESENRFEYEKYVDLEEYVIYQTLTRSNRSKFILIVMPKLHSSVFNSKKEEDFDMYYKLDLTKEYKLHYNL